MYPGLGRSLLFFPFHDIGPTLSQIIKKKS